MAWEPQADVPGGFADEASLCAGLRAGRREAFEALHGAYAAPIYNLALRIVDDPDEAQDVAQEVLIKVFKRLPGEETGVNLQAWLYRVTVNAAFDHVRARKRRPLTALDGGAPEQAAVVDEYERAELAQRVEATLRDLPKRQQVALVLRDVHGLSVAETATALGVTRGSADVLLSRARNRFRRIFTEGAGAVTAGARCRVADEALAAGVGGGDSARAEAALLEHARSCPQCRKTVDVWGAAPVGLCLLLPQAALPAKLTLGATLAAAQAAGVAVPAAGYGAAQVAGASAVVGVGSATCATSAASGGGGVLAALGSVAGLKVATLAAAAAVAAGVAGLAAHESRAPAVVRAGVPTGALTMEATGGGARDEAAVRRAHSRDRGPRRGLAQERGRGREAFRAEDGGPGVDGSGTQAGSNAGSQGARGTGSAVEPGSAGGQGGPSSVVGESGARGGDSTASRTGTLGGDGAGGERLMTGMGSGGSRLSPE